MPPVGEPVTDSDPSHYFGSEPAIDIEKATNGEDADTATGPFIPVGDAVTWTYEVTNTGNVDLTGVVVTDDMGVIPTFVGGDANGDGVLQTNEIWVYQASGVALDGQYANLGTVVGYSPLQAMVSDEDPSHYFGLAPAIDIEKYTNGEDADEPTGPEIPVGDAVTWTYEVANTGNVPLEDVTVVDDNGTPADTSDDYTCVIGALAVGETDDTTCVQTGVSEPGQYGNIAVATGYFGSAAVATGQPTLAEARTQVTDSDPSHYLGTLGALTVTKEVELLRDAGTIADPDMTFEICLTGPSYAEAACVLLKAGESHTWADLVPGQYQVTETAPVDPVLSWATEVVYADAAEAATVVAEETAEVTVLNIADYQSPPTAVNLEGWEATVGQSGVLHTWQTVAENGVSGFRVYRGSSASFDAAELVGEIAAKGPSSYQWVESGVAAGAWHYWLVEVDGTGAEMERFGPKAVTVGIGGQRDETQKIYLPLTLL